MTSEDKKGRFERLLTLFVGLIVMTSMIAYDVHSGTMDAKLNTQQIVFLIGRYAIAGWLINPKIIELVADVVKSVWGRK